MTSTDGNNACVMSNSHTNKQNRAITKPPTTTDSNANLHSHNIPPFGHRTHMDTWTHLNTTKTLAATNTQYSLESLLLVHMAVLLQIDFVPSNGDSDVISHYFSKLLDPLLDLHEGFCEVK
mgnify:CR=1 FL=1